MKSRFFKSGVALISLGTLFAGCSSDEILPEPEQPVDRDSKFYVNVTIANPAEQETRAENSNTDPSDYENGTADEQKINSILFVFYNSTNQYVGSTTVNMDTDNNKATVNGEDVGYDSQNQGDPAGKNPNGSIETIINMTVPVEITAGSLKPASVMAYINPTSKLSDQQRSFSQAIGLTRTLDQVVPEKQPTKEAGTTGDDAKAAETGHKGFTMTNSVYYDTTSDQPQIAVAIPEGGLFSSKEAALKDTEENKDTENPNKNKVVIYVERVVAKVTLNKEIPSGKTDIPQENNTAQDASDAETKYTLNFNILGWGLGNLEKGTFLVKNFRSETLNCTDFTLPYFSLTNMDKSAAEDRFNELTTPSWNFPSHAAVNETNWGISGHRSFWAMSPTYFTGASYPTVDEEYNDNKSKYNLQYLSFNDIYNTKETTPVLGSGGNDLGKPIYTLEHTMQQEVVTNHQKRAVTCALVVGQYSLTKEGETTPVNTDAFFIRNGIDNDGNNVNVVYKDETTLKKAILSANNRIYIKNPESATDKDGNKLPEYSPVPWDDDNLANFVIKHPAKDITEGKYTPNRYVALQLKEELYAEDATRSFTYYLRDANGVYNEIKVQNLKVANTALYSVMSGVEKYDHGYAYFAVPVMHLWGRNNNQIGDEGFSAKLGQYGIVRNHLYNIKVQGISGIGTGIGDPDMPIVPNVETEKYFVKTVMYVQRWRVVPSQSVTLRP